MSRPTFVFVTSIATPSDKVWQALTDPDITEKCWFVHDAFDEGSRIFDMISKGWPAVVSSLKSLLETGKGLEPSWAEDAQKRNVEAEAQA